MLTNLILIFQSFGLQSVFGEKTHRKLIQITTSMVWWIAVQLTIQVNYKPKVKQKMVIFGCQGIKCFYNFKPQSCCLLFEHSPESQNGLLKSKNLPPLFYP